MAHFDLFGRDSDTTSDDDDATEDANAGAKESQPAAVVEPPPSPTVGRSLFTRADTIRTRAAGRPRAKARRPHTRHCRPRHNR